jgi:predicted metal-dependent enzyme (double-stranded beta helix superfamily)
LAAIASADFNHDNVQRIIESHFLLPESLEPYIVFSPERHTRNLIFKNEIFECLAMCWDIGQSSAVHDHNDRLGWMYLASGRLFIQNYNVEARDPATRTCRLTATNGVELNAAQASDVDREHGVHKVSNLAKFGERAVSLHIYQVPMESCQVYSLEDGTYATVRMSYITDHGQRSSAAKSAAAL